MRRREFLGLGGAVALCPLNALGQQGSARTVGFLFAGSLSSVRKPLDGFLGGLEEAGHIVGKNVAIEYRDAQGQYARLPTLAADLVNHRVDVIVAIGGVAPAKAAMASTKEIPIVFSSGGDPVKAGLVKSLNRPGGNITGVSIIFSELPPKLLGILRQLAPSTSLVGVLVNPTYPEVELQITELSEAAETAKQPIQIEKADSEVSINKAFEKFAEHNASAILVANDPYLGGAARNQIIALVAQQAWPAIYFLRDFVEDGGLMSYGPSIVEAYRQCGIYAGKILNGTRPAELPVVQPTKLELLINLRTAKSLNLVIPPTLLALADEVIE
jgi:putative tryptophan/tyrosine transport system substrate-binding protein